MMFNRRHRWILPLLLPFLGGAGTCGILMDIWSWDEITDTTQRVQIDVEEGRVEIAGYARHNVWIQRHVYAFERMIDEVVYEVVDATLEVTFRCSEIGDAVCFADHWLEVPEGHPLDISLDRGALELFAVAGPVEVHVNEANVRGQLLRSPNFELELEAVDEVSLGWANVPLDIDIRGPHAELVEIIVPAGTYACDIHSSRGQIEIDSAITCSEDADASLRVILERGDIRVHATE